jgi:hypothetical protein
MRHRIALGLVVAAVTGGLAFGTATFAQAAPTNVASVQPQDDPNGDLLGGLLDSVGGLLDGLLGGGSGGGPDSILPNGILGG